MRIDYKTSLPMPIQSIQNFSLCWEINDHARVKLWGILERNCNDFLERQNYSGSGISIYLVNEEDGERNNEPLFQGIIQEVCMTKIHSVREICIHAASASVKLDEKAQEKYCSFQDISMRYSDMAKQMAEMAGGRVIYTAEDSPIQKPIICYQETIWEFLKRIASHKKSYLIPDIKTGNSNLWVGMRKGKEIQEELSAADIKVVVKKKYTAKEDGKAKMIYYLQSRSYYPLGDWAELQGRKYIIFELKAEIDKGELWFSYKLSPAYDIETEMYYHEKITGMSLEGTVEETRNEEVRVSFVADKCEGKWFFPWKPETGNTLYAVPEVGAKVMVYFMNHEESSGIAIRCISEKEEKYQLQNKFVATPEGGRVELLSSGLNITKKGEVMELSDSSAVYFGGGKVEIEADGKVKFNAKQILFDAAGEIKATAE